MVSLRQWWGERWHALADWQRSLGGTLAGGFVLGYVLPFLQRVVGSLATFTQLLLAGLLLVVVLFHRTRRRIDGVETELDDRLRALGGMQRTALRRIDYIVTTVSDATPDGGERVGDAHDEWLLRAERRRTDESDALGPVGVVSVGCVGGLLAAVGAGLGDIGSLPVTLVAMAGGLVAAGAREAWTRGVGRSRDAPGQNSGRERETEAICDPATLLEARSLAFLLDRRDVEVGDGRVTFRSRDGGWDLHLEPDAESGDGDRDP